MITSLEKLKPDETIIALFKPYFRGNKRDILPLAINLYKQGSLEGERQIIGSKNIPFVATWSISSSFIPAASTRFRLQFEGNPELSYALVLANHQLIDYLIDVLIIYQRTRSVDFPKAFYCHLLGRDN